MLDVIIPCCEMDGGLLYKSVPSIRKNVTDGIGTIYIVGEKGLEAISNDLCCEYVSDINFMGFSKHCIFSCPKSRTGWIYQQLIKLSADRLSKTENFLVFDADHILLSPHNFVENGKYNFYVSDEFHQTYFNTIKELLGDKYKKEFGKSFINDKMIFNKSILKELKDELSNKSKYHWIKTILDACPTSAFSGFSEFETYGTYVYANYKDLFNIKETKRRVLYDDDITYNTIDEIKEKYGDYDSITQGKK